MPEVIQIHHIDDRIYYGEHPDGAFANELAVVQARMAIQENHFRWAVSAYPNLNSEFPEVERVNDQLQQDFGADMEAIPITIFDPNTYASVCKLGAVPTSEEGVARARYGHVILKAHPELLEYYGSSGLIDAALSEGVRAYRKNSPPVIITEQIDAPSQGGKMRAPSYDYQVLAGIGGLLRLCKDPRDHYLLGSFWEQGIIGSYRTRRMTEWGIAWDFEGRKDLLKTPVLGFTGPNLAPSGIDRDSGRAYIPWRYAESIHFKGPGGIARVSPYADGVAAYGIDLLDRHAPGLYATLLASRIDHRLYEDAKAKIEAIEPGLFDFLNELCPNGVRAFHLGLKAIERALGIDDKPVDLF